MPRLSIGATTRESTTNGSSSDGEYTSMISMAAKETQLYLVRLSFLLFSSFLLFLFYFMQRVLTNDLKRSHDNIWGPLQSCKKWGESPSLLWERNLDPSLPTRIGFLCTSVKEPDSFSQDLHGP